MSREKDGEKYKSVVDMCHDLCSQVQLSQDSVIYIKEPPSQSWNLTTLFGILLGYPVVYWFEEDDAPHCLNGVDLRVCTVKHTAHPQFVLLQFSFPSALANCLLERVRNYCERLYSRDRKFDVSFSDANYPSLAL